MSTKFYIYNALQKQENKLTTLVLKLPCHYVKPNTHSKSFYQIFVGVFLMSMQEIHPHRTGFQTKIIVIIVNTKVMQAMRYIRG